MSKRILWAVFLLLLCGTSALAQQYNSYQIQFLDRETDRPYDLGTSVSLYIYAVGTTTELTVFKDMSGNYTCTQPITDNSTNTPLLYTTGMLQFYARARSFKITVTDGTYTKSFDNLTAGNRSITWPPAGVAGSGYALGQNDDLDFSFAGIILDGDTAGQVELIPDADGGILKIGDATTQMDLYWYTSETDYIFFDEGNGKVSFVDEDVLFDDDAKVYVGTDSDFQVKSSTAKNLDILPVTTDESSIVNFGANTTGVDVKLFPAATGDYLLFDASANELLFVDVDIQLDDDGNLIFGTDDDFTLESDTTKVLEILPAAASDDYAVNLGVDQSGVDLKAFGATTGEYLLWDASEDTLTQVGGNALFTVKDAEANQFKVDATGTVAGNAIVFETTNGGVQFNVDGAANGDLDIDADSTIDVNALDDISITVASGAAGEDLSLTVSGATDSSILLTSAGTGVDAIGLSATAGTFKAAADKFDFDTTNDLEITVTSSVGGEDLLITQAGANDSSIIITAAGTGTDAIALQATAGSLDVDAALATIDATGVMEIKVTSSEGGEDLKLTQSGANDSSITLTAAGTGADAIGLAAAAGTVKIAGALFDFDTTGDMDIKVTADGAGEDLLLQQVGAFDASVTVSAAGTGADAIGLQASAGGIDIDATGSTMTITNTANGAADDLTLSVAGNFDSSLIVTSAGSGTDALTLSTTANAGDLVISSNDKIDMDSVGTFALNAAGDTLLIQVDADGAADDLTVKVAGNQDASLFLTSEGSGTDALTIQTSTNAGDLVISSNDKIDVDSVGTSAWNVAGDTFLLQVDADGVADDLTIKVAGAQDASVDIESEGTGTDAIKMNASAGGIDIDGAAGGDIAITSTGKSVVVTATEAAADAIKLNASDAAGGITVAYGTGNLAITGTGASADFTLDADLLSIDGTGTSNVTVTSNAGSEDFTVALAGNTDSSLILSSTGTGADALQVTASAGGIDISGAAGGDIDITSTGKSIHLTATEEAVDGIHLDASTGAGGVTVTAGTGEIILNPSSGVSFSDKNITNVGTIALDKITDDATAAIGYFCKTRKVTLAHTGHVGADFAFSTAADHTQQNIDCGAIIPAHARVLDVTVICTEGVVGESDITICAGNASAGEQFFAAASCDDLNETVASAAGAAAFVAANNAAQNLWIGGDPSDNTWADMSAGTWTILISYLDLTSAE